MPTFTSTGVSAGYRWGSHSATARSLKDTHLLIKKTISNFQILIYCLNSLCKTSSRQPVQTWLVDLLSLATVVVVVLDGEARGVPLAEGALTTLSARCWIWDCRIFFNKTNLASSFRSSAWKTYVWNNSLTCSEREKGERRKLQAFFYSSFNMSVNYIILRLPLVFPEWVDVNWQVTL